MNGQITEAKVYIGSGEASWSEGRLWVNNSPMNQPGAEFIGFETIVAVEKLGKMLRASGLMPDAPLDAKGGE